MTVAEAGYTCFPDRVWNGKEALLEVERKGTVLTVTVTSDGVTASRTFTPAEVEELAAALAYKYRNIRMSG